MAQGFTKGAAGTDSEAIHDNVDGEISAVTVKGTPVDGDFVLIEDSAASDAKKHITLGTLPSHTPAAHTIASHSDTNFGCHIIMNCTRINSVSRMGM